MRFISLLTAAALLSVPQIQATPVGPRAPAGTNTGNVGKVFTNAFNFCEDLRKTYGNPTLQGSTLNMKREAGAEPFVLDLDDMALEERGLEKRETLSPALPLGRSYNVIPNSRGHLTNTKTYYPIGNPVGPCILFSFGGSYFQGLIVTADPFRLIYPASLVNNDFKTATKVCQAACDSFVRLQSIWSGGSAQCQAISPWVSIPPTGDPFKPLGDFMICDLFPKALSDHQIEYNQPFPIKDGLLANAVTKGVIGTVLGSRDEAEN